MLKIPQYLVRLWIFENRAQGHTDDQILAAFAVHIFALAVRPIGSKIVRMVAQIEERMEGGITLHNDTPAVAPISSIGAAAWHILFAAEAHTAVAPFAAAHQDFCLINEHCTLPHTLQEDRLGRAEGKGRDKQESEPGMAQVSEQLAH
jgi:hypothetical protein